MKRVQHLKWLALCCCGAWISSGAVLAQDDQAEKSSPLKVTFDEIAKKLGRFKDSSRHAPEFEKVFVPLSTSVAPSTVQLWANDRQIMLGTIIDSSGLILTKASELKSPLECRLENGSKLNTRVIGIDTLQSG